MTQSLNRPASALLVCASLLLGCLPPISPASAAELWVAPDGADANPGTREQPLATVAAALRQTRELRRSGTIAANEPAQIFLRDGVYPLQRPLRLRPEDSGTASGPTVIAAAPGEHPVLSGGIPVTGWRILRENVPGLPEIARGKVWVADAPRSGLWPLEFRQLWVNDRKAVRASTLRSATENGRTPAGETLARFVAWDKTNQVATIPAAELAGIQEPGRLEMVVDQVWEIAVLRVKSIRVQGTNALVTFKQPESKIEFQHPWPPVTVNAKYHAPFYLANAIQFLDSPGEWFEDVRAGKIYYWPRDGEDLTDAKVFAPALETVLQVEGTLAKPVSNIQFQGITFAHTTWLRPSRQGHVPMQAGMFMLDARKLAHKGMPYHPGLDNVAWVGRPPAAVSVKNANHLSFERCAFEHTASSGLDLESGTHDDLVEGCRFSDIGINGIQLGKFSGTKAEIHVPWNPSDEREICANERLVNNLVTGCTDEDWGGVGITAGYVRGARIEHNEVSDCSYTGISVGWGWTKMTNALRDNFVHANYIHHVGQRLGDLGGIYTLSAQPGTVVAENRVADMSASPYVPDPKHWFYLYLDEGSSFITVRDNWCPAEKFLKNANGPGNVWENNGPQVSEKIKNAAGIEPAFQPPVKPANQ